MGEFDISIYPVCAIHQPNFFPWLGYFDKIRSADVFVILDQVAYPKSGQRGMGSWVNRVHLNINGSERWIRCPIVRARGAQPIHEISIDDNQPWRTKLLKTISQNYGKAPNYAQAIQVLEPLVLFKTSNLMEFNLNAIHAICDALGISCRFVLQSDLGCSGSKTELLVDIVKKVGAESYLCGGGAAGYQEDHKFEASGINLIYQNFSPQPYGDPSRFIPGLSVIDFLMWADDWRS